MENLKLLKFNCYKTFSVEDYSINGFLFKYSSCVSMSVEFVLVEIVLEPRQVGKT